MKVIGVAVISYWIAMTKQPLSKALMLIILAVLIGTSVAADIDARKREHRRNEALRKAYKERRNV